MKYFKPILALVVIGAMAVTLGCSKKDENPTGVTTPTNTTLTQQTYAASTGKDVAFSCDDGINNFSGYLSGFKKGAGKTQYDSIYWFGPDPNGWYRLFIDSIGHVVRADSNPADTINYSLLYKINFYPTPVAPDSVEWYVLPGTTPGGIYSYHGKIMPDGDAQHVKGFWRWDINPLYGYDYTWVFTFDSVSVAPNDYQGHYNFTCNYWPCYTGAGTGYTLVTLTGDFRFNVDGSGAGTLSINSTEVVRYVFYAENASTRGYYTLLTENWATQHPFGTK